jgi:hypothetical protein
MREIRIVLSEDQSAQLARILTQTRPDWRRLPSSQRDTQKAALVSEIVVGWLEQHDR